jgi:adhesin transport system membrane fusion protein
VSAALSLPVTRMVRTPHAARGPARAVALLLFLVVFALFITPWQQTSWGEGRVIAYAPVDRLQRIEAPIEGRVAAWYVQEGSVVAEGDKIVEISDNDPDILSRLKGEKDAVHKRLDAARLRVVAAEARIKALTASRDAANKAASFRVRMAGQRVTAADKAVEASTAAEKTAKLNLERQKALVEKGLSAVRALELADLDYARASTDLDRAKAASALARSEEIAIESDRLKVDADTTASIEDANATVAVASIEVANSTAELQRIDVRLARQGAQTVKAPRAGTILRIHAPHGQEFVKSGDILATIVPLVDDRAVELWVDGRDVPLLHAGGEVRIQFEGWPALQFSGWPSVAVGTFGGKISVIDASDDGKGKFRVLVTPALGESWPSAAYLRQGVRAHGWFLLGRVRLGYELWRQFNGFPPVVAPPQGDGAAAKKEGK